MSTCARTDVVTATVAATEISYRQSIPAETAANGFDACFAAALTAQTESASAAAAGAADDSVTDSRAPVDLEQAEDPMTQLMHDLFGVEAKDDGFQLSDILHALTARWDSFRDELGGLLEDYGIRDTPPVELHLSGDGRLRQTWSHPDQDKIAALLEDHPELSQEYTTLTAGAEFLRAVQEGLEFQRAYRADPYEAVRRFAYLFEGSASNGSLGNHGGAPSTLRISGGDMEMILTAHGLRSPFDFSLDGLTA